jgi:hypothetical protein
LLLTVGPITVALSALIHHYVQLPGMALGHRLSKLREKS